MVTVQEFDKKFDACEAGDKWGRRFSSMEDAFLHGDEHPEWIVWDLTRPEVLTHKELRLFLCFCVRQNWNLLTDERLQNSVEVAEKYANGKATKEELNAANEVALTIAEHISINKTLVRSMGDHVSINLTIDVESIIWDVVWCSSSLLHRAIRRVVEFFRDNSERVAQLKWLRENTKPDFKRAMKEAI